jgi:hypothetical protein
MSRQPKRLDIPFTSGGYKDGTRELAVWAFVAWVVLSLLLR